MASPAKEKHDRTAPSLTCQPSRAATASRTVASNRSSGTSARSSAGGSVIPRADSFRRSAGLMTGSSPVGSSAGGCRGAAVTSRAGTSSNGLV